jgi:DNA polymerase-4
MRVEVIEDALRARWDYEDGALARLLPGKVGRLLRERAQGIDQRPLETVYENISIGHEETFERDIADVEQLRDELRRMSASLAEYLRRKGETARTVTTKVRYPDFAIRSRSTSIAVGTDDADRIAELACALLDRALADRPGALRLVGVGLSGLETHRQLTIV